MCDMRCKIEELHHLGEKSIREEVIFKGRLKDKEKLTQVELCYIAGRGRSCADVLW